MARLPYRDRGAGLERAWPPLAMERFRVPGRLSQGRRFRAGRGT